MAGELLGRAMRTPCAAPLEAVGMALQEGSCSQFRLVLDSIVRADRGQLVRLEAGQ
jgi:hypothetical protein